MTLAQETAEIAGIGPGEHDPAFFIQHQSAYAFARDYARGTRVLEVGFGEGFGANSLAEVATIVVGVDMVAGNIPRASARYQRANLTFLQMRGTRLEFPDASFDLVCSFQVIEHVPEPQLKTYLSEIKRVLTPSGLFCVSTLNLAHNMKPGVPYEKLKYHEKEFTAPELQALLSGTFPSVRMFGLHLTWKQRLFRRLKKWGLMRIGPAHLNPIARFYENITVHDYVVTRDLSDEALDLIALCCPSPDGQP